MCAYLHTYIHIYVYIYIYTFTHIIMCIYIYIYIYIHTYIHLRTSLCVYVYVHEYTCVYTYLAYICVCTYMYIYTIQYTCPQKILSIQVLLNEKSTHTYTHRIKETTNPDQCHLGWRTLVFLFLFSVFCFCFLFSTTFVLLKCIKTSYVCLPNTNHGAGGCLTWSISFLSSHLLHL